MAKVQFSPIISAVRKKLGNVVFTVNRFGPVMRKRVKGINPKSTNQSTVRTAFSAATRSFAGLGTTDQAAWDSAAAGIPKSDIFGKSYTNTGNQLQVEVNTVRGLCGLALAATPPATGGAAPGVPTAVAGVGTTNVVTVTVPTMATNHGFYLCYTTAGLKTSQLFIGSKYRLASVTPTAASGTTFTFTPETRNSKLSFAAGQDVAVKIVLVDINGYKLSTYYGRFTAS